jgi:hypothetical protein
MKTTFSEVNSFIMNASSDQLNKSTILFVISLKLNETKLKTNYELE